MAPSIRKTFLMLYFVIYGEATQQNKTLRHVRRLSVDDTFYKNQKQDSYRSYQPVSIKYHKASYPRADERTDYDNSYDTEYGGVVSNFTSSIYEDNPPLYPNPEDFSKNLAVKLDSKGENEVELPDDSLADADLKEHNIIDSVTYLYGFSNCHGPRNEYIILVKDIVNWLIFINTAITSIMILGSLLWLMLSEHTKKYRQESKLYPITVNLCCSFIVCMLIYVKAVSGSSSPAVCEKIALLLHYTYLTCALWIMTMAAALTEYCSYNTIMPIKYNYLFAYGIPAFFVMFNYALSMEQYEIKHYCWMSLEKGMVTGFMVPAMLLIIINTGIILLGLKVVNKKQSESLQTRLQELFERHEASFRKNGQDFNTRIESDDALDNIHIAGTSRKNTDSSETLDREYNGSDENCYVNIGLPNEENMDDEIDHNNFDKDSQDRGVTNAVDAEPLWMKFDWGTEGNDVKTYLNLCLVLEPFFAINWVMGVAAIENAGHWTTPTIYLILAVMMYAYFAATICSNLPMMVIKKPISTCCEDIVGEPVIVPIRTTDSIPLLNPAVQKTNGTPAPADTISTISI